MLPAHVTHKQGKKKKNPVLLSSLSLSPSLLCLSTLLVVAALSLPSQVSRSKESTGVLYLLHFSACLMIL